jgi:hypothetical protein
MGPHLGVAETWVWPSRRARRGQLHYLRTPRRLTTPIAEIAATITAPIVAIAADATLLNHGVAHVRDRADRSDRDDADGDCRVHDRSTTRHSDVFRSLSDPHPKDDAVTQASSL